MTDYIDRSALYAEIVSWRCDPCIASGNDHNRVMCRACDVGDILDLIENFQIDDIKLVKTGHWEKAQEQPYFRKHFDVVSCSVCHVKGNRKYKYCPRCGAKMDELASVQNEYVCGINGAPCNGCKPNCDLKKTGEVHE